LTSIRFMSQNGPHLGGSFPGLASGEDARLSPAQRAGTVDSLAEAVDSPGAFQERRAAAVAWVEGQFQLIESALLWLDRPGVVVEDGCWPSRAARGWMWWFSRSPRSTGAAPARDCHPQPGLEIRENAASLGSQIVMATPPFLWPSPTYK
jgi:hypothetical protein